MQRCRTTGIALGAFAMLLAALLPCSVQAQGDYPNKSVRIIVPTGAGGATDFTARNEIGRAHV